MESPKKDGDIVFTKSGKLIQDESVNTGNMAWTVYTYYFSHMGSAIGMGLLAFLFVAVNPFRAWADTWCGSPHTFVSHLSCLRAVVIRYGKFSAPHSNISVDRFIWIYILAMALFLITTIIRSFMWAVYSVRAADYIHDQAIQCILRCPTTFFETT